MNSKQLGLLLFAIIVFIAITITVHNNNLSEQDVQNINDAQVYYDKNIKKS